MAVKIFRLKRPVSGAAVHALLIGISDYNHLFKLPASVHSVLGFAQWLLDTEADKDLAGSLASITLAVKPVAEENEELDRFLTRHTEFIEEQPARTGQRTEDQLSLVAQEWRNNCSRSQSNVAVAYFVGHGITQRNSEHLFLLDDFQQTENGVQKCVSALDLETAMLPTEAHGVFPNMARRQLLLFDACGEKVEGLGGFAVGRVTLLPQAQHLRWHDQKLERTILYAAEPEGYAHMVTERRLSVFCDALIHALNGGAAEDGEDYSRDQDGQYHLNQKWHIHTRQLRLMMQYRVNQLLSFYGGAQTLWERERCVGFYLRQFAGYPRVGVLVGVVPPSRHEDFAVALTVTSSSYCHPRTVEEVSVDPLYISPYDLDALFADHRMLVQSASLVPNKLSPASQNIGIKPVSATGRCSRIATVDDSQITIELTTTHDKLYRTFRRQ